MPTARRNFLKQLALGGTAIAGAYPLLGASDEQMERADAFQKTAPAFNMCGYAAPTLETVRIGIVGVGMRGSGAVERLSYIEGATIVALGDKHPDRIEKAQKTLAGMQRPKAKEYSGEEGWRKMCEDPEIDLIYTCTPWTLHTPIAVYAMTHGKHVATEVPAALTLDECWQLVDTSEKTKRHCMMLENCCYDFFELLTLNLVRQGLLGEIVHSEGAYIHDLSEDWLFNKRAYADMWRLKLNIGKQGNLYPTHGLGPVAQCMNINRGDVMEHLVSMSTADFSLGEMAKQKAANDPFFAPYADKSYRGNMNNTIIRTVKGKTILLQHDVSTPRPYSRIHLLSGTKGMAQKWPGPARIALGHSWLKTEEQKKLEEKYTLPLVKHIGDIAKEVGGHGGMDFIMDWRLIDCLRNGLPLDQDVYDAASWSAIVPLSIRSAEKRSKTVDIPDFTRGQWKTNAPVQLSLEGGATTTVRSIQKKKE
jgi:hypothetical protein